MLDMVVNAAKLFVAGKLFRDNLAFFRQWGIGFVVALLLMAGLSVVIDPWLGMLVGGALGGALLPWLFKDLKYN
jgi:hypothetical protein